MRGPCPLRTRTHTSTHTHIHVQTQAGLQTCTQELLLTECRDREHEVLDEMTENAANSADGLICACVCLIFASLTPFPACPPTQHMSPAPCGFLVPNPSHHLILGCVISTRIICGSHACLCPLCSVLADGDAFLSINRERFTLQPNFHQRDFLSLFIVPVKGYTKNDVRNTLYNE